ncbi:MAG: BMP family lipoprotein [Actinomycetota bacterium]
MKKKMYMGAMAATAALALAACGSAPEDDETAGGGAATGTDTGAPATDFLACMVSDSGGFDDGSFNENSALGLDQAAEQLGVEEAKTESASDTDYAPNVDTMVQQGCDLVFGVGFLLADALTAAAAGNPDVNFALIDSGFGEELPNTKPLLFATQEASYLAGYLAAGVTETGKVATFGGMQIPSVAIFMDGFVDGVAQYNEDNGTSVEVLGWDKEAQEGSFSGDFENQSQGQALTENFIAQGADIIMPVAGPVGLGAAAAAETAGAKIIWVDSDGTETTSYGDIVLTSVLKGLANSVFDTTEEAVNGNFSSDPYIGTIANDGVGITGYGVFDADVPQELKDRIEELRGQIGSGELVIESPNAPQ